MSNKPSEVEVLDAVRKLILWAGDDPDREGLIETPKRVAKAYKEFKTCRMGSDSYVTTRFLKRVVDPCGALIQPWRGLPTWSGEVCV